MWWGRRWGWGFPWLGFGFGPWFGFRRWWWW